MSLGIGRKGPNTFYLFAKSGMYRGTFLDTSVYFNSPLHGTLVFRWPSLVLLKEDRVIATPEGQRLFSSDEMIRIYPMPGIMSLNLLRQMDRRQDPTIEYEILREAAELVEFHGFLQNRQYEPTDRRYFDDCFIGGGPYH